MAKRDKGLYDRLRASGVRKKVAASVADAAGAGGTKSKQVISGAASDLRELASDLEDRARGGPAKRKAAAKKAANTRKRNERKRSEAAKKAARTRAKS
jgi:molecular chaperone GrpE (heat shock protein)